MSSSLTSTFLVVRMDFSVPPSHFLVLKVGFKYTKILKGDGTMIFFNELIKKDKSIQSSLKRLRLISPVFNTTTLINCI